MTRQKPAKPNTPPKLSEDELCPADLLAGQEAAFQADIDRLRTRSAEFVQVPCPACGSDAYEPALKKFGFPYVSCSRCRTLFLNPRPTPAIMADYYADSENYKYWQKYIFPASEQARREKLHKPWLEKVLAYCSQNRIFQGDLLEIGSGYGTFCGLAHSSGRFNSVTAVEPTPEMAQACRERGLKVISKRFEDITPQEVARPDVIVAFEVLEHLFDPGSVLAQCQTLLKPGGLIVLSCPNGLGFDIALLQDKSLAIDVEHVNLFNPQSLSSLVETKGFEVLDVSTPGRLDVEFVREAVLKGEYELPDADFLRKVILEDFEMLGWSFQQFLAANQLSSHMWLVAQKDQPHSAGSAPGIDSDSAQAGFEDRVKQCYATWSTDYYKDYYAAPQAYPPVHTDIVKNHLDRPDINHILDAGCGPASMLRDLADLDANLYGFDLTPAMVSEARRIMQAQGCPPEHIWSGSVLERKAFQPPSGDKVPFDAAICVGVLPHIPPDMEMTVFTNLRNAVRKDGLVMLEARNQLFALFTLNRYSYEFMTDELIHLNMLTDAADVDGTLPEKLADRLQQYFQMDMPPVRKGKSGEPGYDEIISRTHNPIVMRQQFADCGFKDVQLLFYHYHCMPPIFEKTDPQMFRKLSVAMEDPHDWRGHFMASVFILAGRRA